MGVGRSSPLSPTAASINSPSAGAPLPDPLSRAQSDGRPATGSSGGTRGRPARPRTEPPHGRQKTAEASPERSSLVSGAPAHASPPGASMLGPGPPHAHRAPVAAPSFLPSSCEALRARRCRREVFRPSLLFFASHRFGVTGAVRRKKGEPATGGWGARGSSRERARGRGRRIDCGVLAASQLSGAYPRRAGALAPAFFPLPYARMSIKS
jgi:hypothetical protein